MNVTKSFYYKDEHFTVHLIVFLTEQEKSTQHGVLSMIFISSTATSTIDIIKHLFLSVTIN